MKNFDLLIIGGGMVGLTLAASLAKAEIKIAIIEAYPPQTPTAQLSNRVSAINLASQQLLEKVGAWQQLARTSAYQQMQVWEKDSFAKIEFDTQGLGVPYLGHIVENHLLQQALWQQVEQQANVEIICAQPSHVGINQDSVILTLTEGQMLIGKLIVGADGAHSWLRQQLDIPLVFRDYGHSALVCNVRTAEPHQHCARQIFSAESILAFLPLYEENLCSIVWSMPPEQAQELQTCDEQEFNRRLSVAFDNRLGLCELVSQRNSIPLTARYARNFAQPRAALVGDAAHTIHPLAGLGVNLGLQDAQALAQEIEKNLQQGLDIGAYRHLRHYERWRKTEAVKMLAAMQGLKELFAGDNPLKKLVRGIGLSATNKLNPIKEQLIKQAMGL